MPEAAKPYVAVLCENEATKSNVVGFYCRARIIAEYQPSNQDLPQLRILVLLIGEVYRIGVRRRLLQAVRASSGKVEDTGDVEVGREEDEECVKGMK
ncbi:MAG: hypothetical protein LQ340_004229, partial [Diploschistes diacapsis]